MKYSIIFVLSLLCACHKINHIPDLPHAVTNNAVAMVSNHGNIKIYSMNGLAAGKTWQDIHNIGYLFENNTWSELKMPETSKPVLASTAVTIGSDIYMIGGYTVAANNEEKSVSTIYKLDNKTQSWHLATHMPIAVDDTVALVYADRYIYLISGWHDTDNVKDVQVFDSQNNLWFKATEYPAAAVFGHSGGIVDNQMIICDGVKVQVKGKNRNFVPSPVCLKGVIDEKAPQNIKWMNLPHHSHTAYYRMAASGDKSHNRVVFAGGSDNPYNYNGIGYNNIPSKASDLVFVFDLKSNNWVNNSIKIQATMDHRSLLTDGSSYYIVGGMDSQQQVSSKVQRFKLN